MKKLILFLSLLSLFSCKSKELIKYVDVPSVKIEYRDRVKIDSLYMQDSVIMITRNDTVFSKITKYENKYSYIRDTVSRVDSVTVVKKVNVIKEVNKLTSWQDIKLRALNWLVIALGLFLIWKYRKIILSLFQ